METKLKVVGRKTLPKGSKMATGKKWRLVSPGKNVSFRGELLGRMDAKLGDEAMDLALFRIY